MLQIKAKLDKIKENEKIEKATKRNSLQEPIFKNNFLLSYPIGPILFISTLSGFSLVLTKSCRSSSASAKSE